MFGHAPRFLGPRQLRLLACALLCAGLLAAPQAGAEKADREKPIFYQGDTGGANLGSKDGELTGNVVITQGTLTIHADRIVFPFRSGGAGSPTDASVYDAGYSYSRS